MVEEPQMSREEKDEKGGPIDEKANEKQQEKTDEKQFDEKWRRDPLSAVIWAGILIWAGVALLTYNLGLLGDFPILSEMTSWGLVFAGAGALLVLEVVIRLLIPAYSGPVVGTLILGMIFLGLAFSGFIGWQVIFAFLLIGIGLAVLIGGFRRRS